MRKEDFHEICDATVGDLEPLIARTTRDQAGYGTFIANLASDPKAFVQFTSSGPRVKEIQVEVDGKPSRIASVLAQFLERIHGATAAERLRIEYFGFDAT